MKYGPLPPKTLPEQNVRKLMLLAERFQRAAAAQAKWAEGAKVAVDFFEGRQWTAKMLAEMAEKRRPALTFNMIAPLIRLIAGYQSNNRTDIVHRPGSDARASEKVAETMTQVEKSIAAMNRTQHVDAEVFLDGTICGRGFFRNILDFQNNDLGEIRERAEDPFCVYIDPDADTYDLNESASFIQTSKYLSIDAIEDCYGKMIAELLRPFADGKTPNSPLMSVIVNDEITPIRYFGGREDGVLDYWDGFYATMGDFADSFRKTLRVVDTEHHIRELRNVLIDLETGDRKVLPLDWDQNKINKVLYYGDQVGNPLLVQQRMVKRIQWTTMCGDMILYDQPSKYDTYSITGYFPYFRRGTTRGAVDDLIDPQKEKNKRRSVEIEMVSKSSNGGWKYHESSLDPVEEQRLRNYGSSPGYQMKWQGAVPPEQIQPSAPPIAHSQLEQKADLDLMKISGINESALGQIDKVQSGRAIEARQRQAVIAIQMYMSNFARSKQLVGDKHLELIQNHYTEQRMFRILGEGGRIVQAIINQRDDSTNQILNDVSLGKYVATVDESPMSATFANAQFEEMMTLLEKMGPAVAPFIPMFSDLIVDMSSLPRKEEWTERLKALMPMMGMPTVPDPNAQPALDPQTGQPMLDPATGQPIMLNPQTGQPIITTPPPPQGGQRPQQLQLPLGTPTGPQGPAAPNAPSMVQGMLPGGQVVGGRPAYA